MNRREIDAYFDPLIERAKHASDVADAAAPHLIEAPMSKHDMDLVDVTSTYTVFRTLEMTKEDLVNRISESDKAIRQANVDVLLYWKQVLTGVEPDERAPWNSLPYVSWFIDHALERSEELEIDKLGRWVGFIQGVLMTHGLLDVNEERDRTRPIFTKAYGSET